MLSSVIEYYDTSAAISMLQLQTLLGETDEVMTRLSARFEADRTRFNDTFRTAWARMQAEWQRVAPSRFARDARRSMLNDRLHDPAAKEH